MLKRVIRRLTVPLLVCMAVVMIVIVYLRSSAVQTREFDYAWYRTPRDWSESLASTTRAQNRLAVIRAEADHFIDPVGPRRAIQLMDASAGTSGEIFFRFVACWSHSSYDMHALIVYCWSPVEQRFIWKAVEDHSA